MTLWYVTFIYHWPNPCWLVCPIWNNQVYFASLQLLVWHLTSLCLKFRVLVFILKFLNRIHETFKNLFIVAILFSNFKNIFFYILYSKKNIWGEKKVLKSFKHTLKVRITSTCLKSPKVRPHTHRYRMRSRAWL